MVKGISIVDYKGTGLKIVKANPNYNVFKCDQEAALEYIKYGGKLLLSPECISGLWIIDSDENRRILKKTVLAMKLIYSGYREVYLRQLNKDGTFYTTPSVLKARGIKIEDYDNIRKKVNKTCWAENVTLVPVIKEIKD